MAACLHLAVIIFLGSFCLSTGQAKLRPLFNLNFGIESVQSKCERF